MRCWCVVTNPTQPLGPWERSLLPVKQVGLAPEPVWIFCKRKNPLHLLGFEHWTILPVEFYTNYTIPAEMSMKMCILQVTVCSRVILEQDQSLTMVTFFVCIEALYPPKFGLWERGLFQGSAIVQGLCECCAYVFGIQITDGVILLFLARL